MIRPRVFISHSSKDKAFVESLVEKLQDEGVETWFDAHQLQPGDSIFQGIQDGLSDSDYLVVVLSQHSAASKWVQAELSAGFMRDIEGRGTRLIPIRIDNTEIPPLIADRVYIDFRSSFMDGLRRLADRLLIEGSEVRISKRFGPDLGLKRGSIEVHCKGTLEDCKSQLADFSLGDIENLLFHKLGFDDLRRICFRVLEQSIEDFGTRGSKATLTTEFLCAIKRDGATKRLIEVLCQEFSTRLCN
jgi:hypothetical protein